MGQRCCGVPGVKDILAGLGCFIVAMAIITGLFGGMIYTGQQNNQKVQRLNQLCVSKGYAGWQDDGRSGYTRCVR